MLNGLPRDLLQAARSLAKARAFTLVCVVSLGIGMVPVIAIPYGFRILETPPSGVNTDGLVEVVTTRQGSREAGNVWSYPDFVDLRDSDTGLAMVGWATSTADVTLQAPGGVETKSSAMFVSANYFKTIGVTLARGRGFDELVGDPARAEPPVILGYKFWQDRLGGDAAIVGRTVTLNDVPHVVVGIAPPLFAGHLALQRKELFVPLERDPLVLADDRVRFDRGNEWVHIHGRLENGVNRAQASAAVAAVTSQLAKQYPATNKLRAGTVEPYYAGGSMGRSQTRAVEAVAFVLTGTVLLVVCLNISGMMQVRSAIRERELSIRQAIGASRARLVRYLLSEAILLASVSGILASLVLFNIPSVISWYAGRPLPAEFQAALEVDLPIILICMSLCLATSLLCGWLPAMRFSRPYILSVLKDEAGGGGFRVGRVHRVTAALQVAIAVPLLVMGAISLDRVRATATSDLGFASDLLYAAPLKLDSLASEDVRAQLRSAVDDLQQVGGVAAVTIADGLPLDFRYRMQRVALQTPSGTPKPISAHVTRIGDGYLDTMGIPLVRGRAFTVQDRPGADSVTIISNSLARQLFPNGGAGEAVGKRLTLGSDEKPQQTLTVVGVTADFPTSQMSTERAQLLLPVAQHSNIAGDSVPVDDDKGGTAHLMLIARSAPGELPAKMMSALEKVVRELDPEFTRAEIVTGRWLRENSMQDFLSQSAVAGVTGGVILMLAALGIYGVVGLMVATRTREIAVRAALGASRQRILTMVLLDVVRLVTPGVLIGVVLTVGLLRLNAENMGISLSRVEPLSYVVGGAIAILVAVCASLAPARRAASVEPMVAMRSI
jgi:predicted permease